MTGVLLSAAVLFFFFFPAVVRASIGDQMTIGHVLSLRLDMKEGSVAGIDKITIKEGASRRLKLTLRKGSEIDGIEAGVAKVEFKSREIEGGRLKEFLVAVPDGIDWITVRFHGKFPSVESASDSIKRGVAYLEDGVIGEEGAFLGSSAYWFPQEEDALPAFDVTVDAPAGYTTVSEGDLVSSEEKEGRRIDRWRVDKPLDGLDIVTSRFHVSKEKHKGTDIYTFFFKEDRALSDLYMRKTKGYLDFYQELIGPYPFSKFAVVESFLPTGYGMPSFTLLGSSVIRLPFIPDTSLGHEIAHNWWGNSVFPDRTGGNWVEALTTYTADYLYSKRLGEKEAAEFRQKQLKGYRNFSADSNLKLKDFIDATAPASRGVGYNKGMMVFHMLSKTIGEDAFGKGLKEFYSGFAFRRASWDDIRRSFEKASGTDLKWFFDQWLERPGGPVFSMDKPLLSRKDGYWTVRAAISQREPAYRVLLPVLFKTGEGFVKKEVWMDGAKREFTFDLESRPSAMGIDVEFDVFRILSADEIPPSFSGLLGDKAGVIVMPNRSAVQEKYRSVAAMLESDYGLSVETDAEIGRKERLMDKTLLILGAPGENMAHLFVEKLLKDNIGLDKGSFTIEGKGYSLSDSILAVTFRNPHEKTKTLGFLMGYATKERMLEAAKRMRYFGEFSFLVFGRDGSVEKGVWPGRRVLGYEFPNE